MRYSIVAVLLVSLSFLFQSTAIVQAAEEKQDPAANAAIQYWKAFSLMPTLDKDQEKILENWTTAPLDDAVKKLIADSQNSLMFMHRAAKSPYCDWGLDYNDGMNLLLPHLQKARDLAHLAALRARYEFELGNKQAAMNDAMAMMTMARHVGRDSVMICILVQYVIEGLTIDLVAPYVPDVKAPPGHAQQLFDRLPVRRDARTNTPHREKIHGRMGHAKTPRGRAKQAGVVARGLERHFAGLRGA